MATPIITRDEIADGLRALGLTAGDNVLVHSALSSLGQVDGGADAVVEALLDVLGPAGHLMAPTFTYSPTTFFDVVNTPGKTGAITEAVRRRPEAVRSWSPTHAVCVIGPEAEKFTSDHHAMAPMAVGSPIDRLADAGGLVLLLGVDHRANTTVHVGETHARLPYLAAPRVPGGVAEAVLRLPSGEEMLIRHTEMPGCSAAFNAVEAPLRRDGAICDGKIGQARCQLIPGQAIIRATVALCRENPAILLCTDPACAFCVESRRRLAAATSPS
jgi:aminoglycoside 3-N-acetyltransferase